MKPDRVTDLTAPGHEGTDAAVESPASRRVPAEEVLVVVPALNESENIADCLESLFADPWLRDARVVVADGGSIDGTRAIVAEFMADRPNLRLTDNPARLQAAGVNSAVRDWAIDSTRFIVRCDAHSTYPGRFVSRVVDALDVRPGASSLVTPMDAVGKGCFQRAAAWVVDTPLGSGGSVHRGGRRSGWVDHGHHAGFRADIFRRTGGYDATFSHNEDAEFDHRLAVAGGRIWLDADIRLDYRMRASAGALARQYWRYGRGRARTVRKHRMRPKPRQLIPAANIVVLSGALVLSPVVPVLLLLPATYLATLVAVSIAAAASLRSACGLWAGIALAVMHNAWGAGFLWQIAKGGPTK